MRAINVVKIVNVGRVLTLNVAQQLPEEKALSVQIWKKLESEEVGNKYNRVVSFCSNKAMFMIHVNEVAKPVVKLLVRWLKACMPAH